MKYTHGGDIYRYPVKLDFSVNINPLGMPFGSIEAAKEGVFLAAGQYPDCYSEALCKELSKYHGIEEKLIVTGNGAAELLYALCQFLRPKKGLVLAPSFQGYEEALRGAGAKTVFWELQEAMDFTLTDDFIDAICGDEEILFLCNPNNPTGALVKEEFLLRIARRCEETGTWFCLDECFLPFLGQSKEREFTMLRNLGHYPHMIIMRAFTKIYGMPGLRLGYACTANTWLLKGIRGVLQPWNVSIPAQMAGIAALQDKEYLEKTCQLISKERQYLAYELTDGLVAKLYPSVANFLFFRAHRGLKERLLEEGILIRACGDFRNLSEEYFRIAIKTHQENEELIRKWRKCAGKAGMIGKGYTTRKG